MRPSVSKRAASSCLPGLPARGGLLSSLLAGQTNLCTHERNQHHLRVVPNIPVELWERLALPNGVTAVPSAIQFDPTSLAKYGRLALYARQLVEGFLSGVHKSPYKGFSVEFAEHRQY